MSKMGNFVMDVQERYEDGESVDEIVRATGTSRAMVKSVIYELLHEEYEPDYPEFC